METEEKEGANGILKIDSDYDDDKEDDEEEEEKKDDVDFSSAIVNARCSISRINSPGQPAEAGIIHKVFVSNFMCHRALTIDLCWNVNFIHGQNGSGKSAILAAVQICLGAGA